MIIPSSSSSQRTCSARTPELDGTEAAAAVGPFHGFDGGVERQADRSGDSCRAERVGDRRGAVRAELGFADQACDAGAGRIGVAEFEFDASRLRRENRCLVLTAVKLDHSVDLRQVVSLGVVAPALVTPFVEGEAVVAHGAGVDDDRRAVAEQLELADVDVVVPFRVMAALQSQDGSPELILRLLAEYEKLKVGQRAERRITDLPPGVSRRSPAEVADGVVQLEGTLLCSARKRLPGPLPPFTLTARKCWWAPVPF